MVVHQQLPSPTKTYSVQESVPYLGVTYDVVLRYIRDKRLAATKVRTRGLRTEWRIAGRELRRFIGAPAQ